MTFFLGLLHKISLQLLPNFPQLTTEWRGVTFFLGKYFKFSLNQVQISFIQEYLPKFSQWHLHDFQIFPNLFQAKNSDDLFFSEY